MAIGSLLLMGAKSLLFGGSSAGTKESCFHTFENVEIPMFGISRQFVVMKNVDSRLHEY